MAGLARLGESRAPLTATSWGVGEVMAAALDAGCRHLVLGIGGSASTDGGIGMLQALGARVTNAAGDDVGPAGSAPGGGPPRHRPSCVPTWPMRQWRSPATSTTR